MRHSIAHIAAVVATALPMAFGCAATAHRGGNTTTEAEILRDTPYSDCRTTGSYQLKCQRREDGVMVDFNFNLQEVREDGGEWQSLRSLPQAKQRNYWSMYGKFGNGRNLD